MPHVEVLAVDGLFVHFHTVEGEMVMRERAILDLQGFNKVPRLDLAVAGQLRH